MKKLTKGDKLTVERKAVYYSATPSAEKQSIKIVDRIVDNDGLQLVRLKGSKRVFQYNHLRKSLSSSFPKPLRYEVLKIS